MMKATCIAAVLAGSAVAHAGTISGVVSFTGKAPARSTIDRKSDPICAKTEMLDDDVIVTNGKLSDVVVHIEVDMLSANTAIPPLVITQSQCAYAPHVAIASPGQRLVFRNADATFHNIHGFLGDKSIFNDSQPAGEPDVPGATVGTTGDIVHLHCDVHPWMNAYVVVGDGANYAVTGNDGAFTLHDIPPGTYTLKAWHPTLGTLTTKVTVGTGAKATAKTKFAFAAKK